MTEADAEYHLGQVLLILADLHPDDQCDAYCNALAFYNARHPEAKVEPEPGFALRLRYDTPLSRAIRDMVEAA